MIISKELADLEFIKEWLKIADKHNHQRFHMIANIFWN
jgi:hypothetical protein